VNEAAPDEPRTVNSRAGLRWLGFLLLIAGSIGLFFLIRSAGQGISAPPPTESTLPIGRPATAVAQVDVTMHVLAILAAVVPLGSVLGRLFRYVGQPPVIGEVVAGILLGPSLLGALWPAGMSALIPDATTDPHGRVSAAVKAIAQLGVVLYMFLVGLELNSATLMGRIRTTLAVSNASIVIPFVLGAALALGLYPVYSHSGVTFTTFALFIGVAMSVTAFPVLARILTDRGLQTTDLGIMALGCAATGDVTAWCLLAMVVGIAQSQTDGLFAVVAGSLFFIAAMGLIVRPVLAKLSRYLDAQPGPLPAYAISGTFVAILLSAMATEAIGIHAIFGAFVLGAILPHDGRLARDLAVKLKDPVTLLLLPAFLAYTGMRTRIGLVDTLDDWLWCAAVVAVATAGKFGGTLLAARLAGQSWRDSAALGTLMNTRGLMELIVLNIGLDLGVISPTLFAIMVIMALVTTLTTAPVLRRILREPSPA
jgi:Kef-type K+ transport system membrane component KefB